ncbi:MAG: hypothetical protein QME60_09050, partial [Verrucomicrobiota bacterium]|nr:hypothetical protein [Verrucomicrobiota bacterium]
MKTVALLSALALAMAAARSAPAQSPAMSAGPTGTAYVVPIHGDVNKSLLYIVRRAVSQAEREGASVLIFEMNTDGGRIDSAEEIMHLLVGLKTRTYTFVNRHALSAGTFVALATDQIFMADGARIGAAAPVAVTPFVTPMDMPSNMTEKVTSDLSALLRWVTEKKGYDYKLVEAMVKPEVGFKIGDRVICPPGQLLTLNNTQAEQQVGDGDKRRPLLSSGTIKDIEELLRKIGKSDYQVKRLVVTPAERLAQFVDAIVVRGLLLGLGLFLLWIEFKTPGFGLPGVSGIILLAIWFWGHHIAGLAGFEEIALFILGVILLWLEIFVFPGFGVVGISGFALMLAGIMMAMVEHYPSDPWYRIPDIQLQGALLNTGVAIVAAFLLGALLARFLPNTSAFRYIALTRTLPQKDGYQSSGDIALLVGLTGIAVTPLRPGGIGLFGERRLDVVTRGEFMEKDAPIVVAETHGNRIV